MGATFSRTNRKLPKPSEAPSWAGARTPAPSKAPPSRPLANGTKKNEDIKKYPRDLQFLSNLDSLGPVRVDHHMQKFQPPSHMNHVLRSRAHFGDSSSAYLTQNHLFASAFSDLLEERKSATSYQEIETLAKKYNIDIAKLDRVSRFVSSLSPEEGTMVRTPETNGEGVSTMMAVWIEPSIDDHPSPRITFE